MLKQTERKTQIKNLENTQNSKALVSTNLVQRECENIIFFFLKPKSKFRKYRDYSFGSIYVGTLLFVEGVLKSRSSQINNSIKSSFSWGKFMCLSLFEVVVYCFFLINILDLDLLPEEERSFKWILFGLVEKIIL